MEDPHDPSDDGDRNGLALHVDDDINNNGGINFDGHGHDWFAAHDHADFDNIGHEGGHAGGVWNIVWTLTCSPMRTMDISAYPITLTPIAFTLVVSTSRLSPRPTKHIIVPHIEGSS